MDRQIDRVTDRAFARLFSDHIDLQGIAPSDYNHRIVRSGGARLLGGIRFYGGDVARPFIEIVAHDFPDWSRLADCAAAEWAGFAPSHLRLLVAANTSRPPNAHLDMSVFLARTRDVAPPDGRVWLSPFATADQAMAMVDARFALLAREHPRLARNIAAAGADDIRSWHRGGHLLAIRAIWSGTATTVGLLAVAPGSVAWIEGDEIQEEVVARPFNGHGFAAAAQRVWAARKDRAPDRLLIGTIDRLNAASRRSAIRAGRAAALDYVFVPLPARSASARQLQ